MKVPNFVSRFPEKKISEFCEATKSYTSAFYDKILSTIVKYLCGWNCMTLYNVFPHPCLYLVTKINLLKKPISSFNPRKQLFLCLQRWFGEAAPPELNWCFRMFSSNTNLRYFAENNIPIIPFFSIVLCF